MCINKCIGYVEYFFLSFVLNSIALCFFNFVIYNLDLSYLMQKRIKKCHNKLENTNK